MSSSGLGIALQPRAHATLVRRVKLLSWLSLAWMTAEGAIGLTAGIVANSIALIGYGLDSTIEGIASIVIIWRFTGDRIHSEHAETRAQKVVAVSFFLLAPYIIVEALHRLLTSQEAQPSWVGIGLAIVSITLMPLFGRAKKRIVPRPADDAAVHALEHRRSDPRGLSRLREKTATNGNASNGLLLLLIQATLRTASGLRKPFCAFRWDWFASLTRSPPRLIVSDGSAACRCVPGALSSRSAFPGRVALASRRSMVAGPGEGGQVEVLTGRTSRTLAEPGNLHLAVLERSALATGI